MTVATACGKVILFGEHAVVYGRPAIAVPIHDVRAQAHVEAGPPAQGIRIVAMDIGRDYLLQEADESDPLARMVRLTLDELGIEEAGDWTLILRSELPMARGLGSGAAISTAIVRALAGHFGRPMAPEAVSALVLEVEKLYHGTPSGIDNTVIAFERPIYFVKGQPPQLLSLGSSCTLLIADTGIPSSTRDVVQDVRRRWEREPAHYEALFDEIGRLAEAARTCMEAGDWAHVGEWMDDNHRLLQELDVSSPELDRLVEAAREAGALGAKLCGAGRGGHMIALVEANMTEPIRAALQRAGAARIIITTIKSESSR